jgi:hypothetical protein
MHSYPQKDLPKHSRCLARAAAGGGPTVHPPSSPASSPTEENNNNNNNPGGFEGIIMVTATPATY